VGVGGESNRGTYQLDGCLRLRPGRAEAALRRDGTHAYGCGLCVDRLRNQALHERGRAEAEIEAETEAEAEAETETEAEAETEVEVEQRERRESRGRAASMSDKPAAMSGACCVVIAEAKDLSLLLPSTQHPVPSTQYPLSLLPINNSTLESTHRRMSCSRLPRPRPSSCSSLSEPTRHSA
jgi:hypothetical protein